MRSIIQADFFPTIPKNKIRNFIFSQIFIFHKLLPFYSDIFKLNSSFEAMIDNIGQLMQFENV